MGIPDHLTCLVRYLDTGQEATLELDMEQQTGSKSGKEYIKAVYCHPDYLTYMQEYIMRNTGLDEAQAGIKIAERISIISDMQITPSLCQKAKKN